MYTLALLDGLILGAVNPMTGIGRLVADVSKWMIALVPTTGALFIAYFAIRRKMSTDAMKKKEFSDNMTSTVIYTVIGMIGAGLIAWVASYFR